jgi:hypothetical protein
MKKTARAKTKKSSKKGATKPAGRTGKASSKKSTAERKASDSSAPTMGWGWPAFRYPLQ